MRTIRNAVATAIAFTLTPLAVLTAAHANAQSGDDETVSGTLTMPSGVTQCTLEADPVDAYGGLSVSSDVYPSSGNSSDLPFHLTDLADGTYSMQATCYGDGDSSFVVFLANVDDAPVLLAETAENQGSYGYYIFDSSAPPALDLTVPDPNADATPATASVTVTGPDEQPLSHAVVTAMVYGLDQDSQPAALYNNQSITDADGVANVEVPSNGAAFTIRVGAPGRTPIYLKKDANGDPTWVSGVAPSSGDAWTSISDASLSFTAQLGAGGGSWQELQGCLANTLAATDDASSDAIPVPNGGTLTYFGKTYSDLYVNNNGNITFGQWSSEWDPDLFGTDQDNSDSQVRPMDEPSDGPSDDPVTDLPENEVPRIAPFWSDVETDLQGSDVVTYGWNDAGTTFCADWADVTANSGSGQYLDTFQVILTKTGDSSSGTDFTVTFNYDQMNWDNDGDAVAGFTSGGTDVGDYLQLPGADISGAMIDGGADALTASSNVTPAVPGRYTFQPGVDYSHDLPLSVEGAAGCQIAAYLPGQLDGQPVAFTTDSSRSVFHLTGLDSAEKYIFAVSCSSDDGGDNQENVMSPMQPRGLPCVAYTTGDQDASGAFLMTSDPEEAAPINETVGDMLTDPALTDGAGNVAGPTLNIRSAEDIEPGTNSVSGSVYNELDDEDTPAPAGTWVYACSEDDWSCYAAQTDANGDYSITGLPDGWYMIDSYLDVEPWDAGDEFYVSSEGDPPPSDATENLYLEPPCYYNYDVARPALHLTKTLRAKLPTTKLPHGAKIVVRWYVGKSKVGTGRTLTLKKAWVGKRLHYTVSETWQAHHHTAHLVRSSKPVMLRR